MRCYADRAFSRFGTIRVTMSSKRRCRPDRQQEAQHRHIFDNRPHVPYPTNAILKSTPGSELDAMKGKEQFGGDIHERTCTQVTE
jgi:hypothetical protein